MFYLGRHHNDRVEMSRHYGRHYSTVGPYACFPPGTCRSGRRIQMAFTMRIVGSRRVEKQIYKLETRLNVCLKQKHKNKNNGLPERRIVRHYTNTYIITSQLGNTINQPNKSKYLRIA